MREPSLGRIHLIFVLFKAQIDKCKFKFYTQSCIEVARNVQRVGLVIFSC